MGREVGGNGWSLEVVRGRDAGRSFPLPGGVTVLGNAPGPTGGIDLSEQEGAAPRRMAAKQASIESAASGLVLRDLNSPGGTFVNRQRVLSGQSQTLQGGDVIQLGGVQLKLVQGGAPAPATPPPARPKAPAEAVSFTFTTKAGAVARSWDDFLTLSAQRWADLRDELTSGRLAGFLASTGWAEWAPDPNIPGSPDERLDAWLGRLPTTRPAKPELEVHPQPLVIKAAAPGASTFSKLSITNTGYRLLRSSVRVEPADTPWLAIGKAVDPRSIVTLEGTDVPIEVRIPDPWKGPYQATLLVESDGGTARVPVRLEQPAKAGASIPEAVSAVPDGPRLSLRDAIARQSKVARLIGWAAFGIGVRALVAVSVGLAALAGIGSAGGNPSLAGPALAFAALGAVAGATFAARRRAIADLPAAAFAGAGGGVLAAAVAVAAAQAVEGVIAGWPVFVKVPLWGAVGALVAAGSLGLIPPVEKGEAP